MLTIRVLFSTLIFLLAAGFGDRQNPQTETATIHIRLLDLTGYDLGEVRVEAFEAADGEHDLAKFFRNGSASGIPFGTYRLRAYSPGFWPAHRDVRVFQTDVWVVMQLEIGMAGTTYCLEGAVNAPASVARPIWLRVVGVFSSVLLDGQTDEHGEFFLCGIPQGSYVLLTVRDGQLLDSRPVQLPAPSRVIIDLRKSAESGNLRGSREWHTRSEPPETE